MTVVLRIAERCAREGVRVVRAPDCERRGNGQSWGHIGGIVNHHTAGGRNVYLDRILIDGRSDLPGPLTNFATLYDGDLAVVAAHPGNHAGASGGWDTAPLPVTRLFNPLTLGNEIQYPGTEPMSPAQWRTILILNRIALEEIGYARHWDRIKFHQGTSITGKVDPGWAPGKTYDVRAFRRDVAAGIQEDDMQADERAALFDIRAQLTGSRSPGEYPGWGSWVPGQPARTSVDLNRDAVKRLEDLSRGVLDLFDRLNTRLEAIEARLPEA